MSKEHIGHKEIACFAEEQVNLRREDASKYREQVRHLREKLEAKLREEPDFQLKKMLLSGSLAKGTALKQLNDIDVAIYVQQDNPPSDMPKFIKKLGNILRELYSNMDPSQIILQEYSVRISFRGSGLDVDLVPISYDGDIDWYGYLYSVRLQDWLKTNIPFHLEFIKRRKNQHPTDFIQVVRLLKYWVKQRKKEDDNFKFKSFLVELILAHLADNNKIHLCDYIEALAEFFNYIIRSELRKV